MNAEDPAPMARVVRVDQIAPRVRQRPSAIAAEYLPLHRPCSPAPSIFIHRLVLVDLARDGAGALPNETVGLLYGRPWKDSDGLWMVVNRYVVARPDEKECSAGHSSLTPEGNAQLRRRAEREFPAEECVGWAHTHTHAERDFSRGDLDEQRRKSAESVGLLSYHGGQSKDWGFTAYLGPAAERLVGDMPAVRGTELVSAAGAHVGAAAPDRSSGPPPGLSPGPPTAREKPWPRGGAWWVVFVGFPAIGAVLIALGLVGDEGASWIGRPFFVSLMTTVIGVLFGIPSVVLLLLLRARGRP